MAISPLNTTDTFRTWYTRTNEIIARLNGNVVSDGITVFGTFVIGANTDTSLSVANNFLVNSTAILLTGNTTFAANLAITSNAAQFSVYAGQFIVQPANGSLFNSLVTVNANATFLGTLTANSTVTVAGDTTLRSNLTVNGSQTLVGALFTRQVLFTATGAILAPAALNDPQYNDYAPTGLADAQILNLNPGTNTVITGLTAPTSLTGGRLLYVQNISATYKVTLASANTASAANNRFTTIANENIDIPPGAVLLLMWTSTQARWRVIAPPSSTSTISTTGNASVGGALTVTGTSTFTGNSLFGTNALVVDTSNGRVGVKTAVPLADLHVTGNTILGLTNVTSTLSVTGVLTGSANASLASNALFLNAATGVATFANTFTANSTSQSYARNFLTSTLTCDGSTALGTVAVSGNASFGGSNTSFTSNTNFSATMKITGRLVIPVGTGLWAV